MAFGKTIIKSKVLESPGSQIDQRRARLPQFMDPSIP